MVCTRLPKVIDSVVGRTPDGDSEDASPLRRRCRGCGNGGSHSANSAWLSSSPVPSGIPVTNDSTRTRVLLMEPDERRFVPPAPLPTRKCGDTDGSPRTIGIGLIRRIILQMILPAGERAVGTIFSHDSDISVSVRRYLARLEPGCIRAIL